MLLDGQEGAVRGQRVLHVGAVERRDAREHPLGNHLVEDLGLTRERDRDATVADRASTPLRVPVLVEVGSAVLDVRRRQAVLCRDARLGERDLGVLLVLRDIPDRFDEDDIRLGHVIRLGRDDRDGPFGGQEDLLALHELDRRQDHTGPHLIADRVQVGQGGVHSVSLVLNCVCSEVIGSSREKADNFAANTDLK